MTAVAFHGPAETQKPARLKCNWTAEDDRRLTNMWGIVSLEEIADRLGRTPYGAYTRAGVIGLTRGVQPGAESLKAAADRTGFTSATLMRILRWYGVRLERPVSLLRVSDPAWRPYQIEIDDVDEAVAEWMACEVVQDAAKRHGMSGVALRQWLVEAGKKRPPKGSPWRLRPEVIDRIVADRRGRESLKEASRRVGISQQSLSRYLKAAGLPPPQRRVSWLLLSSDVDRVVAALPERTKKRIAMLKGRGDAGNVQA